MDWSDDKSSLLQNSDGKLSLTAALVNAREALFVLTCMSFFAICFVKAITDWGMLLGLTVGGILSGALGLAMFAAGLHSVWVRTALAIIAALILAIAGTSLAGVSI